MWYVCHNNFDLQSYHLHGKCDSRGCEEWNQAGLYQISILNDYIIVPESPAILHSSLLLKSTIPAHRKLHNLHMAKAICNISIRKVQLHHELVYRADKCCFSRIERGRTSNILRNDSVSRGVMSFSSTGRISEWNFCKKLFFQARSVSGYCEPTFIAWSMLKRLLVLSRTTREISTMVGQYVPGNMYRRTKLRPVSRVRPHLHGFIILISMKVCFMLLLF